MEYTYDSVGNMVSKLENDDYLEDLFTEYQYDESGNRVYLTSYTEDGEIKGTQNWEYDDRGRVVKSTTYHGGEKPTSWYVVEYVENEVAEQ